MATTQESTSRKRVPASERRDALISAAMHHFARTGLYGTSVDPIARDVGVAQPYVFSLFGSKRELFLAAVERCFEMTTEMFERAAEAFDPARATEEIPDELMAMAAAYVRRLQTDRDLLMLQLQAYAACEDEAIRERVRAASRRMVRRVAELSGAEPERLDEFFRYGMWLNTAAAMGDLEATSCAEWLADADANASADADADAGE
jgi:AcrR family transcriptional regulator